MSYFAPVGAFSPFGELLLGNFFLKKFIRDELEFDGISDCSGMAVKTLLEDACAILDRCSKKYYIYYRGEELDEKAQIYPGTECFLRRRV